jgi:hypothetical protein
MTINVLISVSSDVCMGVFGNKNNATGAKSSVVVECENVLLLSMGKPSKYCLSLKKMSDFNSTIPSMYCIGSSLFTSGMGLQNT